MDADVPEPPSRQLVEAAMRVVLQHCEGHELYPDWRGLPKLRRVLPGAVDGRIEKANFRHPTVPSLRRAKEKGLWPKLKKAYLTPGPDADNVAIIEAFVALFPELETLELNGFGHTDPVRELAALAAARWPQLRNLSIRTDLQSPWAENCSPGEAWTAALAELTAAEWPVEYLIIEDYSDADTIDFPVTHVAGCFGSTLTRLSVWHELGERGAAAFFTAPLPPNLTHLELNQQPAGVLDALAATSTPWHSLKSFESYACLVSGNLGGLGAAMPTAEVFKLKFPRFAHPRSLFKGLVATQVTKLSLSSVSVGVLRSAAGVRLPALKSLSIADIELPREGSIHRVVGGLNALLHADLPSLEHINLDVECGEWVPGMGRPRKRDYPHWREIYDEKKLPEEPWPALKSFRMESVYLCGPALDFLKRRVFARGVDWGVWPPSEGDWEGI